MSELVNKGAFGCLYHPGIECSGKTMDDRRYATKLVVQDEVADNEVTVGNIVKGIVNYGVNFVPVIDTCTVKLEKVRRHNPTALNKCDISDNPNVKFLLMKMPYIDSLYFYEYLDSMGGNKKKIISCIFDTYVYLIESIERLVEHEVVHYDINLRNILMNLKTDTPIIIDFGLSIPVKRFKDKGTADKGTADKGTADKGTADNAVWATYFYKYSPDYYLWPLEAHVINFLQNVSGTLTRADVETICEACVNANDALRMFSKGFRARYLKACIEQCEQWIGVERGTARAALLKGWPTWDNYSLSIAYLQILEFIYSENGFTDNHLVIQYVELLLANVHPDPARRNPIHDTKRAFTDLFYMNKKVETYDSIVENFNARAFAVAQTTVSPK